MRFLAINICEDMEEGGGRGPCKRLGISAVQLNCLSGRKPIVESQFALFSASHSILGLGGILKLTSLTFHFTAEGGSPEKVSIQGHTAHQ